LLPVCRASLATQYLPAFPTRRPSDLVGDDRRGDESGGDAGRGPADAENGVAATRAGVVHGVVALRGVVVALPAVALRFTGFLVHAAGLAVAPDAGAGQRPCGAQVVHNQRRSLAQHDQLSRDGFSSLGPGLERNAADEQGGGKRHPRAPQVSRKHVPSPGRTARTAPVHAWANAARARWRPPGAGGATPADEGEAGVQAAAAIAGAIEVRASFIDCSRCSGDTARPSARTKRTSLMPMKPKIWRR